jgi:hypothetical protein
MTPVMVRDIYYIILVVGIFLEFLVFAKDRNIENIKYNNRRLPITVIEDYL